MARLPLIALLLISSATLASCGKKPPADLPPNPMGAGMGSGETGNGGWGDPNAGQNGMGQNGGAAVPGSQQDFVASVAADRVLFDTDRFNIDSSDMVVLQSQAQWLGRYPGTSITVEGHADERGTRDYNLALGDRRANAARNYLVSLGIDANRIRTVSYGKEMPQALGSDEASWAQNRRAVTVTVR